MAGAELTRRFFQKRSDFFKKVVKSSSERTVAVFPTPTARANSAKTGLGWAVMALHRFDDPSERLAVSSLGGWRTAWLGHDEVSANTVRTRDYAQSI